jgi:hypothetical protein
MRPASLKRRGGSGSGFMVTNLRSPNRIYRLEARICVLQLSFRWDFLRPIRSGAVRPNPGHQRESGRESKLDWITPWQSIQQSCQAARRQISFGWKISKRWLRSSDRRWVSCGKSVRMSNVVSPIEELPSVEDLQEVVDKLRSEMESCRKKCPMRNKVLRINGKRGYVVARFLTESRTEATMHRNHILHRMRNRCIIGA